MNKNNRLTGSFSIFPQKFDYFNLNTFNPSDTTANFHQRGWFVALNEQATFESGALLQSSFSVKQFDGDIFGNSGAAYEITPDRNFGGWFNRQHREPAVRHILQQPRTQYPFEVRVCKILATDYTDFSLFLFLFRVNPCNLWLTF